GSIAASLIGLDVVSLGLRDVGLSSRPQILTIMVMGLVLSCASSLRVYENHRWRRVSGRSSVLSTIGMAASIGAKAICLVALAMDADAGVLFAAVLGVLGLIAVVVIRRSRLGLWGQSGIAAAAIVGLMGFFAAGSANRAVDLTLALSSEPQTSIATAERMLA